LAFKGYFAFLGVVFIPPFFAEEKLLLGMCTEPFSKLDEVVLLTTIPEEGAVFLVFFDFALLILLLNYFVLN
jgi:hypothetical protein